MAEAREPFSFRADVACSFRADVAFSFRGDVAFDEAPLGFGEWPPVLGADPPTFGDEPTAFDEEPPAFGDRGFVDLALGDAALPAAFGLRRPAVAGLPFTLVPDATLAPDAGFPLTAAVAEPSPDGRSESADVSPETAC